MLPVSGPGAPKPLYLCGDSHSLSRESRFLGWGTWGGGVGGLWVSPARLVACCAVCATPVAATDLSPAVLNQAGRAILLKSPILRLLLPLAAAWRLVKLRGEQRLLHPLLVTGCKVGMMSRGLAGDPAWGRPHLLNPNNLHRPTTQLPALQTPFSSLPTTSAQIWHLRLLLNPQFPLLPCPS